MKNVLNVDDKGNKISIVVNEGSYYYIWSILYPELCKICFFYCVEWLCTPPPVYHGAPPTKITSIYGPAQNTIYIFTFK